MKSRVDTAIDYAWTYLKDRDAAYSLIDHVVENAPDCLRTVRETIDNVVSPLSCPFLLANKSNAPSCNHPSRGD